MHVSKDPALYCIGLHNVDIDDHYILTKGENFSIGMKVGTLKSILFVRLISILFQYNFHLQTFRRCNFQ